MFFIARVKVHSWLSIGKYGILFSGRWELSALVSLATMVHLFLSELA